MKAVALVATQPLVAFGCCFVQFWDWFFRGFPTDSRKAEAQGYTIAE